MEYVPFSHWSATAEEFTTGTETDHPKMEAVLHSDKKWAITTFDLIITIT